MTHILDNISPSETATHSTPSPKQQLSQFQTHALADLGIPYLSKTPISSDLPATLLAAASTLLSLMPNLQKSEMPHDLPELQASLIHEIKAFEYACHCAHYRQDSVFAARYILCVAIDDAIEKTSWQASFGPYRMLVAFNLENWAGEGFFQLLDNLSQHPKQHIELLELMYYCLSLGFEGKYRHILEGYHQLTLIRGELYQLIREVDHDFALTLSDLPISPTLEPPSKVALPSLKRNALLYLCYASLSLSGVYLGLSYLLNLLSEPTLQHLLTLTA